MELDHDRYECLSQANDMYQQVDALLHRCYNIATGAYLKTQKESRRHHAKDSLLATLLTSCRRLAQAHAAHAQTCASMAMGVSAKTPVPPERIVNEITAHCAKQLVAYLAATQDIKKEKQ